MTSRQLAVAIVSYRRADLLDRALASVEKWLPDAPVHVWDNRSVESPAIEALAARHPDVAWTFAESDDGHVPAMNRLMARLPDHDVLQLDPDAELLGPLTRAREVLAEPGVAVVSPTVVDPEGRERPWDVARREQSVVRDLVGAAGYAERFRGRGVSDLYPAAPVEVDGYLTGCALLVSRDAWTALGPYDERFFVHGEDATWQPAARAAGWTLRLVDDVDPQVRHAGARTTADDPLASRRGDDLARVARVMVLGNDHNAGPGSLFAAGSTLLERVQRSQRLPRRRRLAALAERAADRPAVVVSSNGLWIGGAERQRVLLANELVARGHPVTLVCLQHLGLYVAELDPRVRLQMQPWWQPVVEVAPTDDAIVLGSVTNTDVGFAIGWRGLGPLARQRRHWLPTTHDPAVLDGPTYGRGQARALRSADGLLVLSAQHHVDLSRHHHLNDTVMAAPNGIPAADPLPYRPATRGGPVRFGMLTRILEYKNPLLLVDALEGLDALGHPDWTLEIFGDGPDRADLEARTPAHLLDRVHWRGMSSGPDHALADIDVLCVPSGFEAFPLVMVEAMTRAVPILASVSGTVPEMLDHGRAGVLVDPLTREAWTAALARVVDDPAGTAALGVAGRERALERYTVSAMVDEYQRAFVRLLGRTFTGAPEEPARLL